MAKRGLYGTETPEYRERFLALTGWTDAPDAFLNWPCVVIQQPRFDEITMWLERPEVPGWYVRRADPGNNVVMWTIWISHPDTAFEFKMRFG
ncbi:MAG: hypothetical protein EOP83_02080 [Verrucomicrobiaceae bacterium]|nr:MAG: hypothetical protein EOP83_02080 [Verrucomicrobiaceae bacterium]